VIYQLDKGRKIRVFSIYCSPFNINCRYNVSGYGIPASDTVTAPRPSTWCDTGPRLGVPASSRRPGSFYWDPVWLKDDGPTGQTTGHCGRPVGWPVIQPVWVKDDGPDDGSAQTPRRWAGRRNRDEAVDALLVVEKYLTTGLHACIILFITKETINSIHLKIHHSHALEQKCNILRHADSIQSHQKLSCPKD